MSNKLFLMLSLLSAFGLSAQKQDFVKDSNQGVCPNGECEVVQYALTKATGLTALNVNNVTSAEAIGQYYNAPQEIIVYGVDFYAYKINAASNPIDVIIEIYLSDANFLPTGAALASKTISVNNDDGTLPFDDLRINALFDLPVTVTEPYIIVLANSSAEGVGVVLNNYNGTPPDGLEENLSSVKIGGNWLRGLDVNIGSVPLDADVLLEPLVSYSLQTDFLITPSQDDGSHFVELSNMSSPILADRMYNVAAFFEQIPLSHSYHFGDGTEVSGPDASHTYRCGGTYNITKTDMLFGWKVDLTESNTQQWGSGPLFTNTTFVDMTAAGDETGCDWPNAFTTIQPAVDIADTDSQIWLAEGTYMITDEITIDKPLSIRGGFPTGGGTQNIDNHPTIIDAFENITANRQRVMLSTHASGQLYLEGLILQNGFNLAGGLGGAINTTGDLSLNHVTIKDHYADVNGGGIYTQSGDISLNNSHVIDNLAFGTGGGVYTESGDVVLINTRIGENEARSPSSVNGGGVYSDTGDITLVNSRIHSNLARSESSVATGGGLITNSGLVHAVNSLIDENQAISEASDFNSFAEGGGIAINNGTAQLINTAVIGNSVITQFISTGGGVNGPTTMHNSLLWNNTKSDDGGFNFVPSEHEAGTLQTDHSLIKGLDLTADGGLDASDPGFNPMFTDEINGDFSLLLESPLIDAGDFNWLPVDDFDVDEDGDLLERIPLDLAGMTRELGANVEIGSFEFQAEYLVGGTLTGLLSGNEITIRNNAGDDLTLLDNQAFVFPLPIDVGAKYTVIVLNQPNDPIQPCTVENFTGTIGNMDIMNVVVNCEVGDDLIFRDGVDTP